MGRSAVAADRAPLGAARDRCPPPGRVALAAAEQVVLLPLGWFTAVVRTRSPHTDDTLALHYLVTQFRDAVAAALSPRWGCWSILPVGLASGAGLPAGSGLPDHYVIAHDSIRAPHSFKRRQREDER